MKKLTCKYYDSQMHSEYQLLKDAVLIVELEMLIDYICDIKMQPKIIKKINKDNIQSFKSDEILDYIVNCTIKYLLNGVDIEKDFDKLDTTNKCYDSSMYIENLCKQLGIKSQKFMIVAGYKLEAELFDNPNYHHLNILEINNKKYLVDCTYKQFFKTNQSSLERLGLLEISPPNVGTFMLLDSERKQVAHTILKQGWIEVTDNNIKHYFDGFTISNRNGLYYELLDKISYETNYTASDYIRFLTTDASQLDYEDRELLGCQMKPLKNYRLNFKIK